MLPATLAHEVKKQVQHYLGATFHMRLPATEQALQRFFNDPDNGLFKGPWVQVRRPFRLAQDQGGQFFDLNIPFWPFRHQWQAWRHLTTKAYDAKPGSGLSVRSPRHTLVTTGTGSGKTECFLYPLLDHCLRINRLSQQQGTDQHLGIKAIVLYPMNALASDQAGRFAEEILKSNQLSDLVNGIRKPRVRVGLYTGRVSRTGSSSEGAEPGTYTEMTILKATEPGGKDSYQAITNRAAMQENPPDILLTNYKMLDYLLLRPKDQQIWRFNQQDPTLLQYLVLDELHTYDGAQGADVACLIRRLKARLQIPESHLCVVGTSATIAGGDDETTMDPIDRLCRFASDLFEENISNDCVITEDRYRVEEITRPSFEVDGYPAAQQLEPLARESDREYAQRMAGLLGAPLLPVSLDDAWLSKVPHFVDQQHAISQLPALEQWGLALAEWLRAHPLFAALLRVTEDKAITWPLLLQELSKLDFAFRDMGTLEQRGQLLMAFLALVAQARELRSGRAFPLVPTQVQFWLRELRRVGALVSPMPVFNWLDEPIKDKRQLPTAHCTKCGEIAWAGLHNPDMDSVIQKTCMGMELNDDVRAIYEGWGFERKPSPRLVILSPWQEGDDPESEDGQQQLASTRWYFASGSLVVREGPGLCPVSGESTFPVKLAFEQKTADNGQRYGRHICPHCHAEDTLMFIGSQAATMASVAIDEVFGSTLNNDAKLLAFTDSVQDASHRAGFFSARTYHFSLRTALQHVIDDAGDGGVPLDQVGQALIDYWSQPVPGRPGSVREVMATLIPPDLREYSRYLEYRNNPSIVTPPARLLEEFITRLNWQATSEFSLMLLHGRTMEIHASATLGWQSQAIEHTIERLRAVFPGISPKLDQLTDQQLMLWILGVLHRQRERGGLYHPYLDTYASKGLWGKFDWRGQALDYRETFPGKGRYMPRMMVTSPDQYHDHVLAAPRQGTNSPWQLVWLRRATDQALAGVDDATLLDLIAALLKCGTAAGLLKCVHQGADKSYYALNSAAAVLLPVGVKLQCQVSNQVLFRPQAEVDFWIDAPSMDYRAERSRYQRQSLNDREEYYRQRYRKGALRRVFAYEHTGLLTTDERENLEHSFNSGGHADDPNVLTATSTLEMGIDIGDLSATMLCSIPPTTASYLQRIGRAGRKTGTALVLSVINQRPHDLFFYARPDELLSGAVEPPGCWLDAPAVLVRQYLAFCFDQAVREGVLTDLPATAKQLIDEVLDNKAGHIPSLLEWIIQNEPVLQQAFLSRFKTTVQQDTLNRFASDATAESLRERIDSAAREFSQQRQALINAQNRLKDQKAALNPSVDTEDLAEIEREEKLLKARRNKLGEITALEVLTEHGLLPNYAFPERGVRFSGSTFNRHAQQTANSKAATTPTIELVRAASSAIRELAPGNHFYTHSHRFDIQQLELGTASQPLIERWAICGQCGHMRLSAEVRRADATPACPQCGYDGPAGQLDVGQHKLFLPFQRSQAVSYMEYYDSLSADKGDERENEYYNVVPSFDSTVEQASGAVGDDNLPFGIEYRAAMLLREVNAGFFDAPADLDFGQDRKVSQVGFEVCADCGVAVPHGGRRTDVRHRRSCPGARRAGKKSESGRRDEEAFRWTTTYLYRELRSEAVRLLLPDIEPEDLDTLEAAIYLGMRIRFQGDPAHLMVKPQIVPDLAAGISRNYLVLMDAVPGGTGYLKSLFQEVDSASGMPGEGIMDVMQKSLNALETCRCRSLHQTSDDTDGCYRCLRTYHLQHKSENISRERAIALLKSMINAGASRQVMKALDDVKVTSLFGSVLEKRFIERLRLHVEGAGSGSWKSSIIAGAEGFEFTLGDGRVWTIELQPMLSSQQGISVKCQPDFMIRCDDSAVKPIAVFTDGFEPHVKPGESESRLPDDLKKRRSILESEQYLVWSISWYDLNDDSGFSFLQEPLATTLLDNFVKEATRQGQAAPIARQLLSSPFDQLLAFLHCPDALVWRDIVHKLSGVALMIQAAGRGQDVDTVNQNLQLWQSGYTPPPMATGVGGDWSWITGLGLDDDLLLSAYNQELLLSKFTNLRVIARLGDSESERANEALYKPRWRRFLALMNLFQFADSFTLFTTMEVDLGCSPDISLEVVSSWSSDWQDVIDETLPSLVRIAKLLAARNKVIPEVEFYNDDLGEDLFADMAWPDLQKPLALLVGDQAFFAPKWQSAGWKVVTEVDLKAQGDEWLLGLIPEQGE